MNQEIKFRIPFTLRKHFLYEYQEGRGNKYIIQGQRLPTVQKSTKYQISRKFMNRKTTIIHESSFLVILNKV